MKLYVGNVPYAAKEEDLEELFEPHGPLISVEIIRDRYDGRSKGYGFVKMENQEDGEQAIEALDGEEMMGRPLKVNPARPREERRQPRRQVASTNQPQQTRKQQKSSPNGYFHNPYTFVPTPPRDKIDVGNFAGDFNPLECSLDHESLKDGLWTGHIPIKLTTVTPLVLLKDDGRERKTTEHQKYDVYDCIPESSLRGMLRSAYEVVTNSRYACFRNGDRLAYRMGREKKIYDKSPKDLLDDSLKPAKSLSELSPADRLFGWVFQKDERDLKQVIEASYKSRIRVVCENDARPKIVKDFSGNPLPLTILGEPKPAQGRFYVAKDNRGAPQEDGLNKEQAGYSKGKGLRGRKHYWHHKRKTEDYWNPLVEKESKEYLRTERKKDSQNRSINGWIKPNTQFTASLYVQNLQEAEVGALLWLLSLPEGHYFRLGYGKPLGFGSVKIELDTECLPLGTSKDWKAYYAKFDACPPATMGETKRDECIKIFKDSMVDAYIPKQENNVKVDSSANKSLSNLSMADQLKSTLEQTSQDKAMLDETQFDKLPFIEGFLQILQGPNTDSPRIHYPRSKPERDPAGKNFEWFVANERSSKHALPAVTEDKGLPYKP